LVVNLTSPATFESERTAIRVCVDGCFWPCDTNSTRMGLNSLLAALNPLAERAGLYTAYELTPEERIGVVEDTTVPRTVRLLRSRGYETSPTFAGIPLQAAKLHPEAGEVHQASLRRIDPQNPRRQYHVHLWATWDGTEIFSHWEYRPDFTRVGQEAYSDMRFRLKTHYRPDWDTDDYERGKADDYVRSLTS